MGKLILSLLSGTATLFCSTIAWGQAADAPSVAEIVVTANKRQQSIGTVGVAITALTGDQMQELGVRDIADLTKVEPSFAVGVNALGEPYYQIRGIGFNTDSVGAPPTVSVYVDEMPYPFAIMTKGASLDLARVEVLKGPQGTLFGQNATGGAINYIAARPTSAFAAGLDVDYGRFNALTVDGFVSGPLTDTLKARLSFDDESGGAWQRSVVYGNTLGNRDNKKARLLLDWTPTDRLKVALNLNGWSDNSDRQAPADAALALISPAAAAGVPQVVNEPIAPRDPTAADWPHDEPPRNDEQFYQASARIDYQLTDSTTLTYLGTYEYFHADDEQSYNGTTSPFYAASHALVHSTFHEVRAAGKLLGNRLDWVVGANYALDKDNEYKIGNLTGSTSAYALGSLGTLSTIRTGMTESISTTSGYGNLEYHLFDRLSLIAGARYTSSRNAHTGCTAPGDAGTAAAVTILESIYRHGVGVVPVASGSCFTLNSAFLPALVVNTLNNQNVSWHFGINWTPVKDTLVYASASRGFKAGSFPNITVTTASALAPAQQEELTAYEAGVKSRLAGGRVKIDGAVFYYDYLDKQSELRVVDPTFGLLYKLINVPKSREIGAELAVTLVPIRGLSLTGSGTYLDSRVIGDFYNYSQFATGAADVTNFNGQQLPDTPKWAGDIGARYDWALGANHRAYLGGDVKMTGSTQSFFGAYADAAAGRPSLVNQAYTLLNLRAGVETANGRWRLEVYGNNVTNTYYTIQINRVDTVARYVGMPATYGVRLSYRY
jgi:iron complex outermembrane recepter protein